MKKFLISILFLNNLKQLIPVSLLHRFLKIWTFLWLRIPLALSPGIYVKYYQILKSSFFWYIYTSAAFSDHILLFYHSTKVLSNISFNQLKSILPIWELCNESKGAYWQRIKLNRCKEKKWIKILGKNEKSGQ